jgi:hypothetical protein
MGVKIHAAAQKLFDTQVAYCVISCLAGRSLARQLCPRYRTRRPEDRRGRDGPGTDVRDHLRITFIEAAGAVAELVCVPAVLLAHGRNRGKVAPLA